MKVTILTNTLYQGNRLLADQVVDMSDEDAKKFCKAELAVPLFAEDLEKMGFELDPEAICDENGDPIEPEKTDEPKADEQPDEPETPANDEQPDEPKKATPKNAGKKGK